MSRQLTDTELDQFHTLTMKAVDGEITPEEQEQLERFVSSYPECQKEMQDYKKLKEVTKNMSFNSPSEEVWDRYWVNVYNRLERGVAWVLFSIGAIILLTYGGFMFIEAVLSDHQLATIIKVGLIFVIGGLVILMVSVLREKVFTFRKDPYKEVQR